MQSTRPIRFLQTVRNLSSWLKPNFQLRQYLLVAIVTLMMSSSWANAQGVQSMPVSKCGTVLSAPGIYALSQSLKTASPTQDCIQISSPGVLLSLGSYSLTGPSSKFGTTAGVRVLSTASGVQILNGSTIQNFGTGVVIEASGVALTNLNVANNAGQGVLVNNASNVVIDNLYSTGNGAAGVELSQSTGVVMRGGLGSLESNGTYGLWVHSSNNNQFLGINTNQNGRGGIYVGESGDDEAGLDDSNSNDGRVAPSQRNVFFSGDTVVNTGDGIRIGVGDTGNFVVGMTGYDNTGTDAADENGNCTNNTWTDNSFYTKNPTCIQ